MSESAREISTFPFSESVRRNTESSAVKATNLSPAFCKLSHSKAGLCFSESSHDSCVSESITVKNQICMFKLATNIVSLFLDHQRVKRGIGDLFLNLYLKRLCAFQLETVCGAELALP